MVFSFPSNLSPPSPECDIDHHSIMFPALPIRKPLALALSPFSLATSHASGEYPFQ